MGDRRLRAVADSCQDWHRFQARSGVMPDAVADLASLEKLKVAKASGAIVGRVHNPYR